MIAVKTENKHLVRVTNNSIQWYAKWKYAISTETTFAISTMRFSMKNSTLCLNIARKHAVVQCYGQWKYVSISTMRTSVHKIITAEDNHVFVMKFVQKTPKLYRFHWKRALCVQALLGKSCLTPSWTFAAHTVTTRPDKCLFVREML